MIIVDEFPRGVPLLLFPVDSVTDALRISKTIKANLFENPKTGGLCLFVRMESK